jgi:hypothetical protein
MSSMQGDTRWERVVLETDRHRIIGHVTLPAEGYRSRLSDLLNREDLAFIPLVNAQVIDLQNGREPESRAFVAVGREHVHVAYEDADEGPEA